MTESLPFKGSEKGVTSVESRTLLTRPISFPASESENDTACTANVLKCIELLLPESGAGTAAPPVHDTALAIPVAETVQGPAEELLELTKTAMGNFDLWYCVYLRRKSQTSVLGYILMVEFASDTYIHIRDTYIHLRPPYFL